MKRREFLAASAGLAGAMVPLIGASATTPCPPGTVSADGGTTNQTVCSAPAGSADWQSRSTAPGVVAAYDFSAPPANGGTAFFGSLRANPKVSVDTSYTNGPGQVADYSATRVIDTTQFPPGSTASLRWDVPPFSGERGDWWRMSIDNYADQFGNGAPNGGEFWLQWRLRMNSTMATYRFKARDNYGDTTWNGSYTNFKHIIIARGMQTPYTSEPTNDNHAASTYYGYTVGAPNGGNGGNLTQSLANTQTGDYSGELVLRAFDSGLNVSHPGNFKYPGMYHNKAFFSRFTVGGSGSTITEENGGDLTSGTVKSCQFQPSSGGSGDNFTDYTTCFYYPTDRWFSMMMHVNLGPYSLNTTSSLDPGNYRGYSNSTVELYGQLTPGTPWRLIHRRTGVCIATTGVTAGSAGDPGAQGIDRIGMFGFLTFMTLKWNGDDQGGQTAKSWISQVILSKGSTMPAAPAV